MCIFVLFLLCFPYGITVFTYGISHLDEPDVTSIDSVYTVRMNTNIGVYYMSLEEYLLGVMAYSIDPTYNLEMLKAQAVILRTNLIACAEEEGEVSLKEVGIIECSGVEDLYCDVVARKELWGEYYNEYAEQIYIAVYDTKNMVATRGEELINLPFFSVSAGTTRNASRLLEDESYKEMGGVSCEYDILAPNYLQTYYFTQAEIRKYFGITSTDEELSIHIMEQDEAGYILEVEIAGVIVSGEEFREYLQLSSSNCTIRSEEGRFIISTKGVGHGIGLSLYGGNEMATSGSNFYDILMYYYNDILIELYV